MAVATFDTLKFAKALREAGVSEKHAEAEVAVLAEAFSVNFKELVTKEDLKSEIRELNHKIDSVEQKLGARIDQVEQKLGAKSDQILAKLGGEIVLLRSMFGAMVAIGTGLLVRLFFMPLK